MRRSNCRNAELFRLCGTESPASQHALGPPVESLQLRVCKDLFHVSQYRFLFCSSLHPRPLKVTCRAQGTPLPKAKETLEGAALGSTHSLLSITGDRGSLHWQNNCVSEVCLGKNMASPCKKNSGKKNAQPPTNGHGHAYEPLGIRRLHLRLGDAVHTTPTCITSPVTQAGLRADLTSVPSLRRLHGRQRGAPPPAPSESSLRLHSSLECAATKWTTLVLCVILSSRRVPLFFHVPACILLLSRSCSTFTKCSLGKCLQCAEIYAMVNAPSFPNSPTTILRNSALFHRQSFACCLASASTASPRTMWSTKRRLDHSVISGKLQPAFSQKAFEAVPSSLRHTSSLHTRAIIQTSSFLLM